MYFFFHKTFNVWSYLNKARAILFMIVKIIQKSQTHNIIFHKFKFNVSSSSHTLSMYTCITIRDTQAHTYIHPLTCEQLITHSRKLETIHSNFSIFYFIIWNLTCKIYILIYITIPHNAVPTFTTVIRSQKISYHFK